MDPGTTLRQFILEQECRIPGATGDFTALLNNVMIEALSRTGPFAGAASEKLDNPLSIRDMHSKGKYLILFDPLDGASNIDVNLSVGTIFSVLCCPEVVAEPSLEDFLQPGTEQVCAGYAFYGQSTMLVLTTGHGVNGFTLDHRIGEFVLSHPEMKVPEQTNELAVNMSHQQFWSEPVKRYVDECLAGERGVRDKSFNMRWVTSMVAEVHRILTRGGISMYPSDSRPGSVYGKLRLMYEANPMSFIIEQAGGASHTGYQRVMEVNPECLHQRVPVILGSKEEVEVVVSYHRNDSDGDRQFA